MSAGNCRSARGLAIGDEQPRLLVAGAEGRMPGDTSQQQLAQGGGAVGRCVGYLRASFGRAVGFCPAQHQGVGRQARPGHDCQPSVQHLSGAAGQLRLMLGKRLASLRQGLDALVPLVVSQAEAGVGYGVRQVRAGVRPAPGAGQVEQARVEQGADVQGFIHRQRRTGLPPPRLGERLLQLARL
jgi:hypothetical protein